MSVYRSTTGTSLCVSICVTLGMLVINALPASDDVLIPVQAEYFAAENMTELVNTVQNIKRQMSNRRFFRNNKAIFAFNLCCRVNYLLEMLIPLCEHNSLLAFRLTCITFYHLKFAQENLGLEKIYYDMP